MDLRTPKRSMTASRRWIRWDIKMGDMHRHGLLISIRIRLQPLDRIRRFCASYDRSGSEKCNGQQISSCIKCLEM